MKTRKKKSFVPQQCFTFFREIILVLVIFLLCIAVVFAQESHDSEIEEGKKLVNSKMSCDNLSNEQLEAIGEYYMEQMHPGEAHKIMDNMMGGEGSESLKQVHIRMARRIYCNDNIYISYGMIGLGGMMGNYLPGYGYDNYGYWNIFWILFFAAVIFLIVWLVYRSGTQKETSSETLLGILKKRFAKGEITKKQFDAIKRDLEV